MHRNRQVQIQCQNQPTVFSHNSRLLREFSKRSCDRRLSNVYLSAWQFKSQRTPRPVLQDNENGPIFHAQRATRIRKVDLTFTHRQTFAYYQF